MSSLALIANVAVAAYLLAAFGFRKRLVVLKVLTGVFFAWALFYIMVEGVVGSNRVHGVDFNQYLVGSAELLAGRDPYADFAIYKETDHGPVREVLEKYGAPFTPRITYPPPFYILLSPLFLFPYTTSFAIWSGVIVLCAAGTAILACRAFGLRSGWAWLAAGGLMLAANPTIDNLNQGQASIVLALLLAAMTYFLAGDKRIRTGAAVAGAIILKVYPAAFLLYLALRRRWRELLIAVGIVTITVIAVAAVWGPEIWVNFYRHALRIAFTDSRLKAVNTSPVVMLALALPPAVPKVPVFIASEVAAMLFVGGLFFYLRKPRLAPAAEAAVVVAALTVTSSWVPQHYLAALIIPYVYLGREAFRGVLGKGPTILAAVSLAITAFRYDYRTFQHMPYPWPVMTAIKPAALILFLVATVWYLRRAAAPPAVPTGAK